MTRCGTPASARRVFLLVLDAGALLAAIDRAQRSHADVRRAIELDRGPFLLSPFVLAELDYFVLDRFGPARELALLDEVARGRYELQPFDREDVASAMNVIQRYRDLNIGLADASLVVIAARAGTTRLLTLDERHFRAIRPLRGRSFTLLPADD